VQYIFYPKPIDVAAEATFIHHDASKKKDSLYIFNIICNIEFLFSTTLKEDATSPARRHR
jgi:hypothetical protein